MPRRNAARDVRRLADAPYRFLIVTLSEAKGLIVCASKGVPRKWDSSPAGWRAQNDMAAAGLLLCEVPSAGWRIGT